MGIFRSLSGTVTMQVVTADVAGMLQYIACSNITVYRVQPVDDLTILLQIDRKNETLICTLLSKRGAEVTVIKREGIYWKLRALSKRRVLITGIALLMALGFYLPTRIFFIQVDGNQTIPTRQILEAAGEAGISFGSSAKQVRSEKVKNGLLQEIPQLQWAGVNTTGCVATISVKERQRKESAVADPVVSSIVATRDGVICDITVTNGNPVCKVGQAVSAGQVLISGYTNCDRTIRATRSKGEVYATTIHKFHTILPTDFALRGEQKDIQQKFSIIFGKNRINFYSGSGILDSSCVKMYEENYVTLPGGFQLPVALVTETWITCQQRVDELTVEDTFPMLSALTQRYLKDQMVAGTISSRKENLSVQEGIVSLTGEYDCIEMIGREQNEEIIKP